MKDCQETQESTQQIIITKLITIYFSFQICFKLIIRMQ